MRRKRLLQTDTLRSTATSSLDDCTNNRAEIPGRSRGRGITVTAGVDVPCVLPLQLRISIAETIRLRLAHAFFKHEFVWVDAIGKLLSCCHIYASDINLVYYVST